MLTGSCQFVGAESEAARSRLFLYSRRSMQTSWKLFFQKGSPPYSRRKHFESRRRVRGSHAGLVRGVAATAFSCRMIRQDAPRRSAVSSHVFRSQRGAEYPSPLKMGVPPPITVRATLLGPESVQGQPLFARLPLSASIPMTLATCTEQYQLMRRSMGKETRQ